jgi:hypothetical protein
MTFLYSDGREKVIGTVQSLTYRINTASMLGFYLVRIQYYQGVGMTYFSITNIFFADHLLLVCLSFFFTLLNESLALVL